MPYDKYVHWPLPHHEGDMFGIIPAPMRPRSSKTLEDQVLKDLAEAKEEIEKKEILDSYAAYAKRAYRVEVSCLISQLFTNQLQSSLGPILQAYLEKVFPSVRPIGRPRMAKPTKD